MDLKTVTRRLSTKHCKLQNIQKNGKFCWTALLHKIQYKVIRNICETFSLRIYVWSTSLEETSQSFTDMCRQLPSQKIYISKLLCCSRITAWNTGTAENWETFVHRPNCINTINNTTVQCNSEDFFFSI